MASSIHIEKVTTGSFLHNDRKVSPSYLIDDSSKNECSASHDEALKNYYELKSEAEKTYQEAQGRRIQKGTIYLKEAIVNLNENHTLKDLAPIKDKLESYGFTVLQMSIHRDEGFKDGDRLQKNYHAHITMFNLDKQGKSVKFGKDYRNELSRLQTFTANALKMERGKVSVDKHAREIFVKQEKPTKRLGTYEYKQAMKLKDASKEKVKNLENQQSKNETYDFREMQKKITALETENSELKKELHKLNTAANKTKELETIKALEAKIQELQISSEGITEQKIQKLELESEMISIKNQARHEEMRASFAEPPSAYEVFSKLTADKDTLDKKEIEKIKKELKAHDRNVKDFAKKIIEGFKSTKTALFSILDKIRVTDRTNVIKSKIEGKESQIEAYTESKEVKNEEIQETTLKAFVEEQEAKIHAHTPKLG